MSGASDQGVYVAHVTPPITIAAALDLILKNADASRDIENVPLADATGYVLAQNITADRDAPPFDRAMMDGYAVSSKDVAGRPPDFLYRIHGETIFAGRLSTEELAPGSCRRIMTGAPLPPGADCVIPLEESETETETAQLAESEIQINNNTDATFAPARVRLNGIPDRAEIRPLRFVAPRGQDVRSGQVVLTAGRRIDGGVMNTLAAFGCADVPVRRLPRVVILSTGDEIVDVARSDIRVEQIRDSNYYALCGSLAAYRIAPPAHQIIPDRPEALRAAINAALGADLLLITGGVSMGDADFVPGILAAAGVQKIFHRVNVKPGKPVWFGRTSNATAGQGPVVFGLPGNPVSCQVGWKIFIEPWLRSVLGLGPAPVWRLPLASGRRKHGPRPEFFPARLTPPAELETMIQLEPLRGHSSGDVRATVDAQGFALHPAERPELATGELVDFYPHVGLTGP